MESKVPQNGFKKMWMVESTPGKVFFDFSRIKFDSCLAGDVFLLAIPAWNPKQPFINGCLVKQPFPK